VPGVEPGPLGPGSVFLARRFQLPLCDSPTLLPRADVLARSSGVPEVYEAHPTRVRRWRWKAKVI